MKFDFLSESDQAYFIHKASTLVEALPYIRQYSGKNIVVKYGGHAMGDSNLSQKFSKDIGLLKEVGINPIIVHGGGPQIEKKLEEEKIKSNFIDGLRVTDIETIKIVEDILSNNINKKIVNDINLSGGKAESLLGNKKQLIETEKLDLFTKNSETSIEERVDLGFVGQPIKINNYLIEQSIKKGNIPVISPLGIDKTGNTYNINADTVAGFIAGSLKASKLLLLTDVAGILDENKKLISSLNVEKAKNIINKKFIVGGMKPKITTCIEAISRGVNQATILDGRISHSIILELFTEHGIGTQIYS